MRLRKITAKHKSNVKDFLTALEEYCVINYVAIEQQEALINLYQELVDVIHTEIRVVSSKLEEMKHLPRTSKVIDLEYDLEALIDFDNNSFWGIKAIQGGIFSPGSIAFCDNLAKMRSGSQALSLSMLFNLKYLINDAIENDGMHKFTLDRKKGSREALIEMWTKMEKKENRKEIADAKKYVKSQNKFCGKTVYSVDENGLITIAEDYKPFPQLGNRANEISKKIEIVRMSAPQRTFSKEQLDYALSVINGEECPFPYTENDKDNLIMHSILKGVIKDYVPQVGMTCYRSVVDDYKTKKNAQIKKEYAIRCRNMERDIDMINKELERAVELYAVKKQLLENLPKEAVNPILYEELEDLDNRINKLNKKLIIEKDSLEAMKKREKEAYTEL